MPYITEDAREELADGRGSNTAGELNYVLSRVLILYMDRMGKSYKTFNDISGAMTECLAEFRRRVIAPYEDEKTKQNGDLPW